MSGPMLEVIALDVQDARAAEAGGADRLELVTDMAADGLTPSLRTFHAVRAAVSLPLRVMLRAGDGFLAGGPEARDALCRQGRLLRAEGADAFVLGFLDGDGRLDARAVQEVCEALDGSPWTFHRAIDHAADRAGLRTRLGRLPGPGPDTVLTAGSRHGVDEGFGVLCAEAAGPGPRVMAGGGLRPGHVRGLRAAGVDAFHIGGSARSAGWAGPVDAGRVKVWRALLDGGSAA